MNIEKMVKEISRSKKVAHKLREKLRKVLNGELYFTIKDLNDTWVYDYTCGVPRRWGGKGDPEIITIKEFVDTMKVYIFETLSAQLDIEENYYTLLKEVTDGKTKKTGE